MVTERCNGFQNFMGLKRVDDSEIKPFGIGNLEEIAKSIEVAAHKPGPFIELNRVYPVDLAWVTTCSAKSRSFKGHLSLSCCDQNRTQRSIGCK